MPVEFIIFVFYKSHLLAYKVETTAALTTFALRLQMKSLHLQLFFPDAITLQKNDGVWQKGDELEQELCVLIDEWIEKNQHLLRTRKRVL